VSQDRAEAILALLETRFDELPAIASRRTDAAAGFVHDVDAAVCCPDCFGELPGRHGCETCRGAGTILERRRRDPYAVDRVQPYGIDASRHELARERDAQLGRLAVQTAAPYASSADELADADQHPHGWERRRATMYARFDYARLELALELLASHHVGVHPSSERGLALLDGWMPDPIRHPPRPGGGQANVAARGPHADRRARDSRDFLVRVLAGEDVPVFVIAVRVCLSPGQVRRIIREAA
jgi:hypothetical protein